MAFAVTSPWQPWYVLDSMDGRVDQVGGYHIEYGLLQYATVKGAGACALCCSRPSSLEPRGCSYTSPAVEQPPA